MHRKILPLAVTLALCAPVGALAQQLEQFDMVETIPWPSLGRFPAYPAEQLHPTQVYVHAGVIRDTNVFRLADGVNTTAITGNPRRGDTIMRAGAGIRHEQRIVGRQSVRLAARGDYHSFDTYSQMDHFAYGLLGEWLWEFTNDLSGTIGWDHRKRLVDLAQLQRPVDQMVTENNAYANAAYRLGPNVRLRGGLNGVRQKRDAQDAVESRSNSVIGGVDYVTPLGNSVGVEARRTEGNSPVTPVLGAPPVDNDFEEREVALVARWVATQQIRFNGRFGRTERQHETFPGLDFDGNTWRVGLDWTPLNKTGFVVEWYRVPRTVIDINTAFVLTRGVTFGPRWAPTEKLVFALNFDRERQRFSDPTNPVLGPFALDETVRRWRLTAGWEPVRRVELSAGLESGERTSNGINREYGYKQLMANARYRF